MKKKEYFQNFNDIIGEKNQKKEIKGEDIIHKNTATIWFKGFRVEIQRQPWRPSQICKT